MGVPHCRQWEPGAQIDSSAGKRKMHTFEKLPTTRPITADKKIGIRVERTKREAAAVGLAAASCLVRR